MNNKDIFNVILGEKRSSGGSSNPPIPTPTAEDTGKVIKVDDNGAYELAIDEGQNTFAGLTDTTITSPTNGQVPVFDSSDNKWKNGSVPSKIVEFEFAKGNNNTATLSNNKTWEDIMDVLNGGDTPVLFYKSGSKKLYYYLSEATSSYCQFGRCGNGTVSGSGWIHFSTVKPTTGTGKYCTYTECNIPSSGNSSLSNGSILTWNSSYPNTWVPANPPSVAPDTLGTVTLSTVAEGKSIVSVNLSSSIPRSFLNVACYDKNYEIEVTIGNVLVLLRNIGNGVMVNGTNNPVVFEGYYANYYVDTSTYEEGTMLWKLRLVLNTSTANSDYLTITKEGFTEIS